MKVITLDFCGVRLTIARRSEAVLYAKLNPPYGKRQLTGLSGHNLANHVMFGKPLDLHDHIPRDMGDWNRCLNLYGASPHHLRRKMLPILRDWARQLREKGYDQARI